MSFLSPSSVAVIGASPTEGKVGHDVLKNLLTQGYTGKVYPINPKYPDILGAKAYPDVAALPETPDLVVIITPAATVVGLLEECGTAGVKHVCVISAGFRELNTNDGLAREKAVQETAAKHGLTVLGVNCLGLLRPSAGLNASFAKDLPPAGPVALLSQSGALAVAIMDRAPLLKLGFSSVLSLGNKTVRDECDYLEMLERDPETKVIGLYLESIPQGQRFREICARLAPVKPIVLLKAGTSQTGQRAISSHTGSLAGSDAAVEALCIQTGVRRAHSVTDFTDLLRVLSSEPALVTPRIAVVTNAGGPGILATDAAECAGLQLPALDAATIAALKPLLPEAASTKNPVDVLGDADAARYRAALNAVRNDPNVDGIVILLTPQVMTPVHEVAKVIAEMRQASRLLPIVTSFVGGGSVTDGQRVLAEAGIPDFESPERAVAALAALLPRPAPSAVSAKPSSLAGHARELLPAHGLVNEERTSELLSVYSLPAPRGQVAKSAADAVRIAREIGLPVIAKISSPDLAHKTDVGGVRANLKTETDVEQAVEEILSSVKEKAPHARLRGVLIQQFLPVGDEFIVGGVRDPAFGPMVMVGLGGIYTELFRDARFRLCPLTEADAYAMLEELKAWKLLLGMRGKPQSDIDALARTVLSVAQLMVDCPSITELDLNPVLVSSQGVIIADAKVIVGPDPASAH